MPDVETTPRTDPMPPAEAAQSLARTLPYDVAFEYALDSQVLTDLQGIILNINFSGVQFFKREKTFLVGKPLALLFTGGFSNPFYMHLSRLNMGMASCSFKTALLRPDDKYNLLVFGMSHAPGVIRWFFHDITEWVQAEAERQELLRRLITVQEAERRKLARDLHDNIGQLLTGLTLALGVVERADALKPEHRRALELAGRVADDLRRAVHDVAHGLRSGLVEESGLYAALQQLIADWTTHEPRVHVELDADAIATEKLPREIETALYSIVQEALTNVFRHSRAHTARVMIELEPNRTIATIKDDGIGFHVLLASHQSGRRRLGLVGMRERAILVGGTVSVEATPGKGTTVRAVLPLREIRRFDSQTYQPEDPDPQHEPQP